MKFQFIEKVPTAENIFEIIPDAEKQREIEASVLRAVRNLELKPEHLLGEGGSAKVYFPERGLQNTCYKVLRSKNYPLVKVFDKESESAVPPIYLAYLEPVKDKEELPWSLPMKEEARITNKVASLSIEYASPVKVPMTYQYFNMHGELDKITASDANGRAEKGYYIDDRVEVLLMDRIEGFDLSQIIWGKKPLSEDFDADVFMDQVDSFVRFLHTREIYHRDIALRNIMMDGEGNPALIDFGRATDQAWTSDDVYTEEITFKGEPAKSAFMDDERGLKSVREELVEYQKHFNSNQKQI